MKKNKDTISKLREKNKRLRSDLAKKKAVSKNLVEKGMHSAHAHVYCLGL